MCYPLGISSSSSFGLLSFLEDFLLSSNTHLLKILLLLLLSNIELLLSMSVRFTVCIWISSRKFYLSKVFLADSPRHAVFFMTVTNIWYEFKYLSLTTKLDTSLGDAAVLMEFQPFRENYGLTNDGNSCQPLWWAHFWCLHLLIFRTLLQG